MIRGVKKVAELTPMMQQYMQTKKEYPDCILFYRLGDFYEMFFDDALTASKELEITLTGKNCGLEERAPMCGVPYHAVQSSRAKHSGCDAGTTQQRGSSRQSGHGGAFAGSKTLRANCQDRRFQHHSRRFL